MITEKKFLGSIVVILLAFPPAFGQNFLDSSFEDGITLIARDSSFLVEPSFRFQTQYSGRLNTATDQWQESLMIRRLRLKFDGFAFSPKVVYKVELGLSNRDTNGGQVPESGNTASIILDAVIKYNFAPNWSLWFGQTKLPGNRERVISSQKLQFVDRSPVNAAFNLDRDIGVQLHHKSVVGGMIVRQVFAISTGEGRDIIVNNPGAGRQYTARLEFFPFGDFQGKGAYFAADLLREPTPKLAVGFSGDINSNSVRSRGNLGSFVRDGASGYIDSDLYTIFVDGIFKYQGISAMFEYAYRNSDDRESGFGYGEGFTVSSGYLFPNDFEVAARFTTVNPISTLSVINDLDEYMIGFSRYIKRHNLKIQSDLSYNDRRASGDFWMFRVQTELAF